MPELSNEAFFIPIAVLRSGARQQGLARITGQISTKSRQRPGLTQQPHQRSPARLWYSVYKNPPPQLSATHLKCDTILSASSELYRQHGIQVVLREMAATQFLPIRFLAEKRFATQTPAGFYNGILEQLPFESMQGVVMDENADGPLGRQYVSQMLDRRF